MYRKSDKYSDILARHHKMYRKSDKSHDLSNVAATHDQSLLQNDTIALSLNSCSRSFCIVDKTVFFLGLTLASFGMYL